MTDYRLEFLSTCVLVYIPSLNNNYCSQKRLQVISYNKTGTFRIPLSSPTKHQQPQRSKHSHSRYKKKKPSNHLVKKPLHLQHRVREATHLELWLGSRILNAHLSRERVNIPTSQIITSEQSNKKETSKRIFSTGLPKRVPDNIAISVKPVPSPQLES